MTTLKASDIDALGEALGQVLGELLQVETQTPELRAVEAAFSTLMLKLVRYWVVLVVDEQVALAGKGNV